MELQHVLPAHSQLTYLSAQRDPSPFSSTQGLLLDQAPELSAFGSQELWAGTAAAPDEYIHDCKSVTPLPPPPVGPAAASSAPVAKPLLRDNVGGPRPVLYETPHPLASGKCLLSPTALDWPRGIERAGSYDFLLDEPLDDTPEALDGQEETAPSSPPVLLKAKRRVGRPIAYHGDPNAPNLTPVERRRMKRRIANRESARRVRARRQGEVDALEAKAAQLEAHNSELAHALSEANAQRVGITREAASYAARVAQVSRDNLTLRGQLAALRLAVKDAEGQHASAADEQPLHAAMVGAYSGLLPPLEALLPQLRPDGLSISVAHDFSS